MSTDKPDALAVRQPSQALDIITPRSLGEMKQTCEWLYQSKLLGDHIKSPDAAFAVAMTGLEIGVPFMAAFRKSFVIGGRVGFMTQLLVAKVKASPMCEYFRTVELTDSTCTVESKRKGAPEPVRYTFTMKDAELAGYTSNKKYKTEPKRMLYARAAGYLCNDEWGDLCLGIETAETLGDYDEAPAPVSAVSPVERVIAREQQSQSQTIDGVLIDDATGEVTGHADAPDRALIDFCRRLALSQTEPERDAVVKEAVRHYGSAGQVPQDIKSVAGEAKGRIAAQREGA